MQSTVSLLALFAGAVSAIALNQQPLAESSDAVNAGQPSVTGASSLSLHGRFLHITGMLKRNLALSRGASIEDGDRPY